MPQIYFDAATKGNPGESTCSTVVIIENDRYQFTEYIGSLDNHSAEWIALLKSLERALELDVKTALVYTDSKLIEDSLNKRFIKNKLFKPYFENFKTLEEKFDLVFVKWIPRAKNKESNQLAQTALRKHLKSIK